ncbi:Gfo/Idh/MocA family protein [Lacticaseibacillus baoqingensis]|uniref:Gfo/Idh/MocA family protein n=1 Tax=Lacticaseibacillus baoqingensis TaxID=2486013 RepID=A0ABW4E575_9LACO|nr:Gfo/Idh/MocA family oxidoreductase [Lacticaseibacillus baoqingensis]
MPNYKWGIIGLGRIARSFATYFAPSQTLYGVAAHDRQRAEAFAQEFNVPHAYDSYADLFADPAIDIVYVATTHNFHYENILQALNAGKHVLAEKAITLSATQLEALVAVAASKHLILMEAQTIYHMPLYPAIEAAVKEQALGRLKTIQVTFGSHVPYAPKDRLLNPALAGGALLDIGIYALSFARRFMTAPPKLVATQMVKTDTGVDGQSSFLLTNANNEQVTVALNLQAKMPKMGMVAYEEGYFTVDQYPRSQEASLTHPDGLTEHLTAGDESKAMAYEIDDMAQAVATGENPTLQWTREVMTIMSQAREAWGFYYPGEQGPLV